MQALKEKKFNLKRTIILALSLMIFDVYIFTTLMLGFQLTLLFSFVLGLSALLYLFKDKQLAMLCAKKSSIYILAFCGIVGMLKFNSYIGLENAKKIIHATNAYYTENKKYPDSLSELVPDYLDAIPVCAYRLIDYRYEYLIDIEGYPRLSWLAEPQASVGLQFYDFNEDTWIYLD